MRKKLSLIGLGLVGFLLVSSVILILGLSQLRETVRAADANMLLFYSGGVLPSGWSLVSGSGGDFYQIFPRGYSSYGSTTGGTATHAHSISWESSTGAGGHTIVEQGSGLASDTHTHDSLTTSSMNSATILPPYRNVQIIKYSGTPTDVLPGPIAIFTTDPGTSWSRYSSQDGKFIRGEATVGGTGGNSTHTHGSVSITTGGPSATNGATGSFTSYPDSNHAHTSSGSDTTSVANHEPQHVDVLLYYNNTASSLEIPVGMIAMFDATPPVGWDVISDSAEDYYERFFQGASTYATGQGTATHTHSNLVITTGTSSSNSASQDFTGNLGLISETDHTHAVGVSFSAANNLPTYRDVIVAQYQAYDPASNNWRWYADEADETPGTAYANENTAPPQVEMGLNIPLKLRINISNNGGHENNSRKKLQYNTTTDQNDINWTLVGEPTDTGAFFRYTTDVSGGDDNDVLTSVLLTGSDATYKGIHNESNSNSPLNSDHPAGKTVEFEYAIDNYKATANTTYYFRLYDQVLDTYIPLAAGKTMPSLTTAAAFTLTVSSPSAVYLGQWNIGSGAYHEYTFVGGEEITNRDNRGQTGGSSSGWTSSAEITTELTNGSDTISKGDMYWITNTITGLYDAPTTGMTGNAGEYMSSSITVITATAGGRQGLGGFTILPTMRIYNADKVGDYSGVVTLTTI